MRHLLHSLLILALLAGTAPAEEQLVDGIAAQVGTDIVLYSEVLEIVAADEARLRAAGATDSDIAKLQAEALEALIEARLIEKVAADADLRATDAEIDATIEAIAHENGVTVDQVRRSVLSQGLSYEDYREEIRGQLQRQKVINSMVGSQIRVEEAEVEALYQERFADQPDEGTTVHLRQILVPAGEEVGQNADQACDLVQRLRQQVADGRPFEELAAQYSMASPDRGGDIGWLHVESMAGWMVELVEPLEPGGVSQVARLPFGCTVVQLVERRTWVPVSYEQAKQALHNEVYNRKLADEYRSWMEELRQQTFIERRGYFAAAASFRNPGFGPPPKNEQDEFESGLQGLDVLGGSEPVPPQ